MWDVEFTEQFEAWWDRLGGDKRDRWQEFYEETIPLADDLFDEHLAALEREGEP